MRSIVALVLAVLLSTPAIASEGAEAFAGLWDTSYGRMRLIAHGDEVTGAYSFGSVSLISGTVENDRLTFVYEEPTVRGEGWFEIDDEGNLAGRWREEGQERWSRWSGTRVQPTAGRVWLVVLEAHWESSIVEEQYEFGEMLEGYFTMAPARHVEVRQRMFHDEDDFRRWCGEVQFIAEPVVLLISSHGTPDGVSVAGTTIGPEVIADSIRGAPNIQLLHLSGCAMMQGDAPQRIHDALPESVRMPISGYSTYVAWDASAIGDYVFLSMHLIRGYEPAEAARQAILVSPFLGEERIAGAAFAPLGLRVRDVPAPQPIEVTAGTE